MKKIGTNIQENKQLEDMIASKKIAAVPGKSTQRFFASGKKRIGIVGERMGDKSLDNKDRKLGMIKHMQR